MGNYGIETTASGQSLDHRVWLATSTEMGDGQRIELQQR